MMREDPICVIATSVHEGKIFADNLGLTNYEVYTNMMQRGMEGKRFREMVISNEYLINLFDALHNSTGAFATARVAMHRRGSGNINY